jgi:hypothetical protein
MRTVLSSDTMLIPNAIRAALETVLRRSVEIRLGTTDTRRDRNVVGNGLKYYTSHFNGRFGYLGDKATHEVYAEVLQGYKGKEERGRTVRVTVHGRRYHFNLNAVGTLQLNFSQAA